MKRRIIHLMVRIARMILKRFDVTPEIIYRKQLHLIPIGSTVSVDEFVYADRPDYCNEMARRKITQTISDMLFDSVKIKKSRRFGDVVFECRFEIVNREAQIES